MIEFFRFSSITLAWVTLAIPALCQGYSPDEAAGKMTVADGLRVKLFASEPMVRQPNFVKCDDRGRLWTIQYLQYPNPAGLKRVKVDRWSRTQYDRLPKPPPHGPRGADKITILEDTDGDGRADASKDFINGLNLVTGVAFGHGGVYVLNVPYLLFYPDRDHDDVPDSDPKVLLTGFGMEDAQSMSNHLTWGPDGWLYGVNGSTTTCRIGDIEFQQGLWRYHPLTHEFELFCEGGSNCYGVTFDEHGELYYSTNGGPFVHAVQGGYYFKSFGKHGPLHNPYTYHYFANLECDQVPGGPPTGGTIYLGNSFPDLYRGKFIAGNFLGHTCSWWTIEPTGSTVRAKFGGTLLDSNDTWFGATDTCVGPDGSMYVCDFHDQRTAHPDPDANWDRSNGRIYRIKAEHSESLPPFDLRQRSTEQLVDLLSHKNHWFRDRARCQLAVRRDRSVVPRLREMALQTKDASLALQGLWAHHVTVGIDDQLAGQLLGHPEPYIRFWTVRLLGDQHQVSKNIAERLAELAQSEESSIVRSQLAASAKRLSGPSGLRIIRHLIEQNLTETDERTTWLIWWAIESCAVNEASQLLAMFDQISTEDNRAAKDNLLRLIRRCAAEGTMNGYNSCFKLLHLVPQPEQSQSHEFLRLGLAERAVALPSVGQGGLFNEHARENENTVAHTPKQFQSIAGELKSYIDQLWQQQPTNLLNLELALRAEIEAADETLLQVTQDVDSNDQPQLTQVLALANRFGHPDAEAIVLRKFHQATMDDAKIACLSVLQKWISSETTAAVLAAYGNASAQLRGSINELLLARAESALQLLQAVDAGKIDSQNIPVDQIRRVVNHRDPQLDELVRRYWGNVGPGSSEQKLATMRRYNNDLRAAVGDPTNGKVMFAKHCGNCHQLHGVGNKVGPDLTTANRSDRTALLANIVDPSAVVRREYLSYVVETTSGRVLTGLLADQNAASVTILDALNQRIELSRDEIEQLVPSDVSLMPETLLDELTPEQLRDLFSYLEQ